MTPGQEERIWRDALTALMAGFAIPAQQKLSRTTTK
jgi:hypothetical protein